MLRPPLTCEALRPGIAGFANKARLELIVIERQTAQHFRLTTSHEVAQKLVVLIRGTYEAATEDWYV
jgi:hypothetical protein